MMPHHSSRGPCPGLPWHCRHTLMLRTHPPLLHAPQARGERRWHIGGCWMLAAVCLFCLPVTTAQSTAAAAVAVLSMAFALVYGAEGVDVSFFSSLMTHEVCLAQSPPEPLRCPGWLADHLCSASSMHAQTSPPPSAPPRPPAAGAPRWHAHLQRRQHAGRLCGVSTLLGSPP